MLPPPVHSPEQQRLFARYALAQLGPRLAELLAQQEGEVGVYSQGSGGERFVLLLPAGLCKSTR